jgi:tetratricopeptide (TPR) repeat protein
MRTLAVALLVAVGWPAHADEEVPRYLDAARKLYESLDYERALAQLQRARRFSRGADDDVAIALHEGILLAELGRVEESNAAFREALFLQPEAALPLKVSPKLVAAFEKVRAQIRSERRAAPPPPPPARLPVVPTPKPAPPITAPTPPAAASPGGGMRAYSWAPAALGLGLGGGGAWFALQAKQRADALSTGRGLLTDQAAALRDEGKQLQTTAIALFAGGGAALLAAGAMFVLDEPPPARVALAISGEGAAVTVQGAWP